MAKSTGLSARQLRLLAKLRGAGALEGFYLAGGSAVGWLCGHRKSADLDLFSMEKTASLAQVVEELTDLGATVRADSKTMAGFDTSAGPVDVVRYPYPLLQPPRPGPVGFPVAGPIDLAVMKLAAIARRGLRRDFWDLYVLLKNARLSLPTLLAAYQRRYRTSASDTYHLARALAFFEDAERDDPRLVGLSRNEWARIKAFFAAQAARLLSS